MNICIKLLEKTDVMFKTSLNWFFSPRFIETRSLEIVILWWEIIFHHVFVCGLCWLFSEKCHEISWNVMKLYDILFSNKLILSDNFLGIQRILTLKCMGVQNYQEIFINDNYMQSCTAFGSKKLSW